MEFHWNPLRREIALVHDYPGVEGDVIANLLFDGIFNFKKWGIRRNQVTVISSSMQSALLNFIAYMRIRLRSGFMIVETGIVLV